MGPEATFSAAENKTIQSHDLRPSSLCQKASRRVWAPVKGGAGQVELSRGQNVPCPLTVTLEFYKCSIILNSKELHNEMRLSLYVCTYQGNTEGGPEGINLIIVFAHFCNSFTQSHTGVCCCAVQSQQGGFMVLHSKFWSC